MRETGNIIKKKEITFEYNMLNENLTIGCDQVLQ